MNPAVQTSIATITRAEKSRPDDDVDLRQQIARQLNADGVAVDWRK